MIIARAPLRITFVGGGTDMESFFQHEPGAIVNATINKYVYITVNKKFDPGIRLKYSTTENVRGVEDIQHPLFREALKHVGITDHIEITSHADIPSRGAGLGSSSSFLVCLLHALHSYKGEFVTPEKLAREAVNIERGVLKEHGGLQDQYIAAYGGIRYMEFHDQGNVNVSHVFCKNDTRKELESSLMMFYTGITRRASNIEGEKIDNMSINMDRLRSIKWQAARLRDELHKGNHQAVGLMMHEYWQQKRALAKGVSTSEIDNYYDKAIRAGATGGKILGAGGGGFFLLHVTPERRDAVRRAMAPLEEMPFELEREGSKIIHVAENFLPGEHNE